jgi:hypothetical protein
MEPHRQVPAQRLLRRSSTLREAAANFRRDDPVFSAMPIMPGNSVRRCGIWVEVHSVSVLRRRGDATTPRGSIGIGVRRW